jgi:hypothetical protein
MITFGIRSALEETEFVEADVEAFVQGVDSAIAAMFYRQLMDLLRRSQPITM